MSPWSGDKYYWSLEAAILNIPRTPGSVKLIPTCPIVYSWPRKTQAYSHWDFVPNLSISTSWHTSVTVLVPAWKQPMHLGFLLPVRSDSISNVSVDTVFWDLSNKRCIARYMVRSDSILLCVSGYSFSRPFQLTVYTRHRAFNYSKSKTAIGRGWLPQPVRNPHHI